MTSPGYTPRHGFMAREILAGARQQPSPPVAPGPAPLAGSERPQLTDEDRRVLSEAIAAGALCRCCVLPGAYVGRSTPMPIEEVGVGETLLMPDGHHGVTVNAVTHRYNGGVKTIHARGVLPLQVTDDHPILIYPALASRRGAEGWAYRQKLAPNGERPVWRRADQVKAGDFAVCPIPRIEGPEPPARWASPDACWLLGMLAGDGHTCGRDGKKYYTGLTMGLGKPVDEAVGVFRAMGYRPSRKITEGKGKAPLASILVCSRDLAEDVASLIGSGARNKHLPDFIWSSKDRLRGTLDGLMATDGCRRVHKGIATWELTTISLTLAWQVWYMALALGEKPHIRSIRRTSGYRNASPSWKVDWSDAVRHLFTIRLDDMYVLPVKKVEEGSYEGVVHDLTAEPSPTFVANGLLTHNCAGVHAGGELACPRLSTFEIDADGKLKAGSYWPDFHWDTSRVIFAEEATPGEEASGGA